MTPYEIVEKVKESVPQIISLVDTWSEANPELLAAIKEVLVQALDVVTLAVDNQADSEQISEYIQEGTELILAIQALMEKVQAGTE